MGVFTRFKDIVSSNINAILDKAEDPEKMLRLMIQEMEETLVEMKSACAGQIADRMKIERELADLQEQLDRWNQRAELAVEKGRDDLAREALQERSRFDEALENARVELTRFQELIDNSKNDITRLEEKITSARQKQRLLVQRHLQAEKKLHAEKHIRQSSGVQAAMKFEQFEQKIDRMEAAANLVNPQTGQSLEEQFAQLENNRNVDAELEALKQKVKNRESA